jgi:hypothetical protein
MTDDEKRTIELEEALDKERNEMTSKISDVIKMINRIDRISEAQVLMLSYRHILVDKMTTFRAALYKRKANDENYRKMRYEYYKTQHDVRLMPTEINQFINSDMAQRIRQVDLLNSQLTYYSQCIETLDKMGFSIKNKVQVEELNARLMG